MFWPSGASMQVRWLATALRNMDDEAEHVARENPAAAQGSGSAHFARSRSPEGEPGPWPSRPGPRHPRAGSGWNTLCRSVSCPASFEPYRNPPRLPRLAPPAQALVTCPPLVRGRRTFRGDRCAVRGVHTTELALFSVTCGYRAGLAKRIIPGPYFGSAPFYMRDRPESGDSSLHRRSGSPSGMQCSRQGGPAGRGDACVAPYASICKAG